MRYDNVKWFVNDRCNLNCPFCFVSDMKKGRQSLSEQFLVLDKLHSEGVKYVDFFGKEPLLDDTIFKIMEYGRSKDYDFIYSFISNGKNLKKYTKDIIDSPCRSFTISYDFCSGDRVYQFDLKDLLPFKDKSFFIELSVDVHSGNSHRILTEINEPLLYGVNSLYFKPITPFGKEEIKDSCITEDNFVNFISEVFDRMSADYENLSIKIPYTFKDLTKFGDSPYFITEPVCLAGKTHFCINSDGVAYGCVAQCGTGNTKNSCDYLKTSEEELYNILSNHKNRERMCGGCI